MRKLHTFFKRTCWFLSVLLGLMLFAGELFAFPYAPSTLTFTAASGTSSPPAQTVTFSRKSFVSRNWTAAADSPWLTLSPTSGTISTEKDTIAVQVDPSGLAVGTYTGSFSIAVADKNGRMQTAMIPVAFVVSTGDTIPIPSILLNPTSLSFSGTAGGAAPLAKTINLTNPTGGTLSWTLTKSAAWLGMNITSGTTTTEVDQISASVSISGLGAGTYSTTISVTASEASNSPQQIPVSLTLNQPTVATGSVQVAWDANTETDLAGYKVYSGTQSGVYGAPVSIGKVTSHVLTNLTIGTTYFFTITAYDTAGNESPPAPEVSKSIF